MEFEWDETKNNKNLAKHELDFNQAKEVFYDNKKIESPDKRFNYNEDRFKVIGKAKDLIITVIYTLRNTVIRIISARLASKKERHEYLNQNEQL